MANGRANHPMYRDDEYASEPSRSNADYHNMNEQQLEHRHNNEFERQDAMLDQIHRGVKGLKNQAHAINNEVVDQKPLIDDVTNRMDDAQGDLERGEAKAREVNSKKAKVCKLYGVIALLIVVEVVLSIAKVDFFPH